MAIVASVFWLAVYGLLFAPLAWAFRLSGRDPLSLRRDPARTSYWDLRATKSYRPMTSRY